MKSWAGDISREHAQTLCVMVCPLVLHVPLTPRLRLQHLDPFPMLSDRPPTQLGHWSASHSLTDSRMFLLSFFTWYSQFSLFTFWPPTFVPGFGLAYPTCVLCLWQLYICWHGGNSSAWSLRITIVSGMFPVTSFPWICYRTEDYHCVSVSHLFSLPLP